MTTPAQKALDTARKLVALAVDKSASPEEARTAAMQAARLIAEHGLLGAQPTFVGYHPAPTPRAEQVRKNRAEQNPFGSSFDPFSNYDDLMEMLRRAGMGQRPPPPETREQAYARAKRDEARNSNKPYASSLHHAVDCWRVQPSQGNVLRVHAEILKAAAAYATNELLVDATVHLRSTPDYVRVFVYEWCAAGDRRVKFGTESAIKMDKHLNREVGDVFRVMVEVSTCARCRGKARLPTTELHERAGVIPEGEGSPCPECA